MNKVSATEVFQVTPSFEDDNTPSNLPRLITYCDRNQNIKTPWTFILSCGDFKWMPESGIAKMCGWATKEEAEQHRQMLLTQFNASSYCAIVMKNADFTEGRGPMVFEKVFMNLEKAHQYVLSQKGIQGTPQSIELYYGVNIYRELYGNCRYNGYEIVISKFSDFEKE